MSEMVERVARAIYAVPWVGRRPPPTAVELAELRAQARAAIEAMREPTEAMVESGAKQLAEAVQWDRLGDLPRRTYRTDAMAVFDAMIDESLK